MLVDYTCTRCFTHPFEEKELFYGCSICGNARFRVEPTLEQKIEYFLNIVRRKIFENITAISVSETGLYHVDVDKLFKESTSNIFLNNG